LNDRHRKYIKKCQVDPSKCEPVKRLIYKHAKKMGVDDDENIKMIYSFVKVGVKSDFLCEGYKLLPPEYRFDISNKNPEYQILGFIDKSAVSDGEILIVDYKTSKSKPSGKDKAFNVQALSYALALRKKFPDLKKIKVRFLYLKFTRSPKMDYEFSPETLDGFEVYLNKIYSLLNNFSMKAACSNFGKNNEYWRLCGGKKGELKKDGNPRWVCPLKYPMLYWVALDENGKIKKSDFEEKGLAKLKEDGYSIEQRLYKGCPIYKNRL
jgi:Ni,Fe-hydrogenase maturation factor